MQLHVECAPVGTRDHNPVLGCHDVRERGLDEAGGPQLIKGLGRKRPSLAVELKAETIFEIATLVRPTDQVELVERSGRRGVERGQKCGFESVDGHVLVQSVHVTPLRRVFVGGDIVACAAADVVLPGPFFEARLSSGQGEKDALSLQKLWHMIELA